MILTNFVKIIFSKILMKVEVMGKFLLVLINLYYLVSIII